MKTLLVLLLLAIPLVRPAMTPAAASRLTVVREADYVLPGQSDWVLAQCYASLRGKEMLRAVNQGDKCVLLRSPDGGQTWGEPQLVAAPQPVGEGRTRNTTVAALYLDPDNGLLVRFLSELICATGAGMAYGDAVGHGPRTGRILYQVSRDAGHTWEAAQQLIESGRRYNARHWARDIWHGRSALGIDGQLLQRLGDGTIVAPAYGWPTDDHMARFFEAQAWPPELRRDAPYFMEARCLRLRWQPDLSGLTMTSSGPIHLPGGYTPAGTCGSDEPAVAYLDDQRWFAVVRTSTSHTDEFQRRGIARLRQCAYTTDGGATWTADTLRFDDGGTVYSPSAWSQFLRSSQTGQWYWIGNITPEPTWGTCDPRYPLQIVELDARTRRLKRATLTVLQDKEPADDPWVRFSNYRVYEERGTGDLIVLLRKSYCEFAKPGLPSPGYRYRIKVSP